MAKNKSRGRLYTMHVIEKELKDHLIEWAATLLSIAGAVLNVFKYIEGFYLWTIGSLLWIAFSWKHRHYGLLLLSIIYLIINIFGIIVWAKA